MIQEGLYATLAADAAVSALVGTRIYPLMIPQQVYTESTKQPCLVYTLDGRARQVRFAGTDTLVQGSLTVDCYARTYAAAQALADAVRALLEDYSGTMTGTGSPISTNVVKKIFIDNELELMDIEPGLYRVSQSYTIWYDE